MDYISVDKLTKKYGDVTAVDNLSFTVNRGEIFGFLGPNGAGKTTTLNVLSTLSDFDRGEVIIAGHSLPKDEFPIKRLLGLVPQEIALYMDLTAAENVNLFASFYGIKGDALKKSVDNALEFVGLSDERKKRVGKMSGGMQRRLNLACGIAHNPELIIMDEPTVGVDARSRDHILNSIRILRDEGATIIYTSHYMPEVQALADRIAIIDKGRLAAIGTEEQLLKYVTDRKTIIIGTDGRDLESIKSAVNEISVLPEIKRTQFLKYENKINLDVELSLADISPILSVLMDRKVAVKSLSEETANLETTFLALTGNELSSGELDGIREGKRLRRKGGIRK
jgi:ABC-2 type transport system ATP-binding protein